MLSPVFAKMHGDHPRFVAQFSYIERGSLLAVINSKTAEAVASSAPMPRRGWGEVGGPYQA